MDAVETLPLETQFANEVLEELKQLPSPKHPAETGPRPYFANGVCVSKTLPMESHVETKEYCSTEDTKKDSQENEDTKNSEKNEDTKKDSEENKDTEKDSKKSEDTKKKDSQKVKEEVPTKKRFIIISSMFCQFPPTHPNAAFLPGHREEWEAEPSTKGGLRNRPCSYQPSNPKRQLWGRWRWGWGRSLVQRTRPRTWERERTWKGKEQ